MLQSGRTKILHEKEKKENQVASYLLGTQAGGGWLKRADNLFELISHIDELAPIRRKSVHVLNQVKYDVSWWVREGRGIR